MKGGGDSPPDQNIEIMIHFYARGCFLKVSAIIFAETGKVEYSATQFPPEGSKLLNTQRRNVNFINYFINKSWSQITTGAVLEHDYLHTPYMYDPSMSKISKTWLATVFGPDFGTYDPRAARGAYTQIIKKMYVIKDRINELHTTQKYQ
mgnify:FL=1